MTHFSLDSSGDWTERVDRGSVADLDAAEADADDRVSGVAEGAQVEFGADQEQEREQGEVAEGRDDRVDGGG